MGCWTSAAHLWVQNLGGTTYQDSLGILGTPRSLFVTLRYGDR